MSSDYTARINRVMDYIEEHISEALSLEQLSDAACFSPYHFHRIFKAFTGETIQKFIQRIRLEKSITQLLGNTSKPVTDVALDCGFSSSATFARAFKEMFGMTASEARKNPERLLSKLGKIKSNAGKMESNAGEESVETSSYFDLNTGSMNWRISMKKTPGISAEVSVREFPETTVVYVRHTGPYKGDGALFGQLFQKLMTWAGPRGLFFPGKTQCLSVYHDNPDITDDNKLRLSVCLTVEPSTQVDGEIGKMTVAGGTYAVARFEIKDDQYEAAWNSVYSGWLPESGYEPADKPCLEFYLNNPQEHPEGKHIVEICIPVQPR